MDRASLVAVDSRGVEVPVVLLLPSESDACIQMSVEGGPIQEFRGSDFFGCLIDARLVLESRGLLLCCQGARSDVFPSGMQRQMGLGRVARLLTRDVDRQGEVDIFAAAKPHEVVSVQRQKVAVYEFFNLSLPGSGNGLGEMS